VAEKCHIAAMTTLSDRHFRKMFDNATSMGNNCNRLSLVTRERLMSRAFIALIAVSLVVAAWTAAQICRYHYEARIAGSSRDHSTQSSSADSASSKIALTASKLSSRAVYSWATFLELQSEATVTQTKINTLTEAMEQAEKESTLIASDQVELPSRIDQLTQDIEKLDTELPQARGDANAALAKAKDFEETIEQRKQDNRERAAVVAAHEFDADVSATREARKKREDLRRQIGAASSRQDEAILENSKVRAAKENFYATFARNVADANRIVDQERDSLRRSAAEAKDYFVELEGKRDAAESDVETSRARLKSLPAFQITIRNKIAEVKSELASLSKLKEAQTLALAEAKTELQHRDEIARRAAAQASQSPAPVVAVNYARASTSEWPQSYYGQTFSAGSRYYDPTYRPPVGDHYVHSFVKRDGTFVNGHMRTDADNSFYNNWSTVGNRNPYTGSIGTKLPLLGRGTGGSTYVHGHFRSNGSYVNGHSRRSR
jgi:hypothetical protein